MSGGSEKQRRSSVGDIEKKERKKRVKTQGEAFGFVEAGKEGTPFGESQNQDGSEKHVLGLKKRRKKR